MKTGIKTEPILFILLPYGLNNILLPVVSEYICPNDRFLHENSMKLFVILNLFE
jgi:hypothetical protein